ncbi:MAG: nitrilase-related carbon-nitrogen hydrolase, partial [Caldilineales bacterium]
HFLTISLPTMDEFVVAVVQLHIRLPQDRAELEQHLVRFVRLAQTKRTRLLVFPQFSGLMTSALVTKGASAGLLKQADRARRTNASFWTRAQAKLAGSAAGVIGADFGRALEGVLLKQPDLLWDSYASLFSDIARYHGMVVVAGSGYLADPGDGAVRHTAAVFGPDGSLLGTQAAVSLAHDEHPLVEPARLWQAIATPLGRLGVLIGNDVLYPEAGRMLAYDGAEMIVGLGAASETVQYHRQRLGLLARVEDNQIYGALSFSAGYNPFTAGDEEPYVGRSLIAAPASMTPRYNGILVEMGTDSTEGLITAEWSFNALHQQWANDRAPLRSALPLEVAGPALAAIYSRGLPVQPALAARDALAALPAPEQSAEESVETD